MHVVEASAAGEGVLTGLAAQVVGAGGLHQGVAAIAAKDRVGSRPGRQLVGEAVSRQAVITGTADGILDVGPTGDGHIAPVAAHVREEARPQVDHLVVGVAREIEGVAPARVPDGPLHDRGRAHGLEPGPARVGVEAVDRIAGPGRHVGAVLGLHGGNVIQQWHGGISRQVGARVEATEIAHHRVLATILEIAGVGGVGGRPRRGIG